MPRKHRDCEVFRGPRAIAQSRNRLPAPVFILTSAASTSPGFCRTCYNGAYAAFFAALVRPENTRCRKPACQPHLEPDNQTGILPHVRREAAGRTATTRERAGRHCAVRALRRLFDEPAPLRSPMEDERGGTRYQQSGFSAIAPAQHREGRSIRRFWLHLCPRILGRGCASRLRVF